MIISGTHPPITIDLGSNQPGMTLQREYRDGGRTVWRDVVEHGQVVKSPVEADALPAEKYHLI